MHRRSKNWWYRLEPDLWIASNIMAPNGLLPFPVISPSTIILHHIHIFLEITRKNIYTQHQNHVFVKSTKSSHKVAFNDIVCLTGQHWVRTVVSFWLNIWWHSTFSEHTPGNWTLHGQCRVRSRKAGAGKIPRSCPFYHHHWTHS